MSRQNIGTPRFYVNMLSWLKASNVIKVKRGRESINPSGEGFTQTYTSDDYANNLGKDFYDYDLDGTTIPQGIPLNFCAILGHNLSRINITPHFHKQHPTIPSTYVLCKPHHTEIVNAGGANNSDWFMPDNDGFTITKMDTGNLDNSFNPLGNDKYLEDIHLWTNVPQGLSQSTNVTYPLTTTVKSFFVGNYFDMPFAPDLSLDLSYEMDGIKNIETRGGATLSNAIHKGNPDWGYLDQQAYASSPRTIGAWQLESPTDGAISSSNFRVGRRNWSLSFSYISDTDIMPENSNTLLGDYSTNIVNGSDFFSAVWSKTMGGHLPFLFQPNNLNSEPDQFCIARFDMDSLKYSQVATNVYNIKLKIRECW